MAKERKIKQSSDQEKKIKELENQLKKVLSDYQNLKRDMGKRLDFEEVMIRKSVMKDLINLADDIDLAIDKVTDEKGWREGVRGILEKFYTVIQSLGGEVVSVKKGDKFDPNMHEAIGTVNEGKDGTVVKVVQNGYMLGEVVVRPARVIVSKIEKKK